MSTPDAARYQAFQSHDPRFDGVFYVGVTSTGIYCRPICTARTPRAAHCRFFASRERAERAGFRPCLRCRPELAPGTAPVDMPARLAALVAERISQGMFDRGGARLEQVARHFGWSVRHIRRLVAAEFGVSPIQLVQTRRLLLAKQLLTDTELPIGQVAYASGFSSLRRFNDLFRRRYGMPPRRFRSGVERATVGNDAALLTLRLGFREPLDWPGLLRFLAARRVAGVEAVTSNSYRRTLRIDAETSGWIEVTRHPDRPLLNVALSPGLIPALPTVLTRLRHLFDLDARPDLIEEHLARDPVLVPIISAHPGARVPGTVAGFELAVRAILGQQVTVAAATTLAGRLAATFGDAITTPSPELCCLFPEPERIARLSIDDIAAHGIIRSRARAIITVAEHLATGQLRLDHGGDPDATRAQLLALPGIGPWTAEYITMRALGWPDVFPAGDVVLQRRLNSATAAAATRRADVWRPWRSYATLLLWHAGDTHDN